MNNDEIEGKFENLPTGKPHVSFSELRDWKECSYRHKLRYVDKIDLNLPSPNMDFGTAIHAACENWLNTKIMDTSIAEDFLKKCFDEKKSEYPDIFTEEVFLSLREKINPILDEVPEFMNTNFEGWELVSAEENLYESISEKYPHAFKGFVDATIKVKGKKDKDIFWILDWKTTTWGWSREKKTDFNTYQQLIFYKNFLSKKLGIDPKNVRCGFVLLKKTATKGKYCELVKISVGNITTERSMKDLNNMLSSVRRGISLKNKNSCKFCMFKDTKYCT